MKVSRALFVVTLAALPLAFALSADAQRGRGRHRPPTHGKDAGAPQHKIAVGDGGAAPADTLRASPDGGVLEAKTLDGGTRVFRFRELDVEGRLTSPQIVYFLRRVRAEFAAGDLGHRSFMGELSETRKSNAF